MTTRLADPIVFGPNYIPRAPHAPYCDFDDGTGYWLNSGSVLRCHDCNRRIATGEEISAVYLAFRCGACSDALEMRGKH